MNKERVELLKSGKFYVTVIRSMFSSTSVYFHTQQFASIFLRFEVPQYSIPTTWRH